MALVAIGLIRCDWTKSVMGTWCLVMGVSVLQFSFLRTRSTSAFTAQMGTCGNGAGTTKLFASQTCRRRTKAAQGG